MKSLRGKNVVVTGGSRGIGYEICKILLENEMNVLAVSRDMTKLQSAKSQLPDLHILQADVSCSDQVRNIAQWVETQWGDLDILVNNAGISPSSLEDYTTSSLLDLTEEAFGQTIKVNVLAPYICTKILLPMLIKTEEPKVINVGSTSGLMTPVLSGAYGVSKAALHALTIASANELAGVVAVNALSPGWVLTDMAPDAPDHPRTSAESALWLIRQDNNVTGKLFHDKALLGWSG